MKKQMIAAFVGLCLCLLGCGRGAIPGEVLKSYAGAREAYGRGNLEEAERACAEILRKRKDFHQARALLLKSLFFQEKDEEAEVQARALLRKRPNHREADMFLVRLLIKTERREEAAARIDSLLAMDPGDPRLLYIRVLAAGDREDVSLSLNFLKEASLYSEEYALVFLDLARLYYVHGLSGAALMELDKALHLTPEDGTLRRPMEELRKKIENGGGK